MTEYVTGRQHENGPLPWERVRDALGERAAGREWRPPLHVPQTPGHVADALATLKPETPPPPTLADLQVLLDRIVPRRQVLLAHPDRVEALQRAADEQQLPVVIHAVPWMDTDQAHLVGPMAARPSPATMDTGRIGCARRVHAAYDQRRRARRRRRR